MSGAKSYRESPERRAARIAKAKAEAAAKIAKAKAEEAARRKKIAEEKRKAEEEIKAWMQEEEKFIELRKKGLQRNIAMQDREDPREVEKFLQDKKEDKYIPEEANQQQVQVSEYNYLEDSKELLKKIKEYDTHLYEEKFVEVNTFKNPSSQKAKLFFKSLKMEYGRVKSNYLWANFYKKSIIKLSQELSESNSEILLDIQKFLKLNHIDEDRHYDLFEKIQYAIEEEIESREIAEKTIKSLVKLNYTVIEDSDMVIDKLAAGEKVTLPVKNQDYQVVIALNKENTILTRFIKTVKSQKEIDNITSSQKLKDSENLKKWCSLQSKLQEGFQHLGMEVEQNIMEDEESDILYIVDRNTEQGRSKKITQKEKERYG